MRRLAKALALTCALALGACATTLDVAPQAVPGQPDTVRFRIFPNTIAFQEALADRAAEEEIGRFRAARGYASSTTLSRELQDRAYVYTVRFER